MSTRKLMREMVRRQAAHRGIKPTTAVRGWRSVWNAYPHFIGEKKQKKGSKQPILKYPVPREARRDHLYGNT